MVVVGVHTTADHYAGLSERWNSGLIYCSPVTARLLLHLLQLDPAFVRPLELDTKHVIHGQSSQGGWPRQKGGQQGSLHLQRRNAGTATQITNCCIKSSVVY